MSLHCIQFYVLNIFLKYAGNGDELNGPGTRFTAPFQTGPGARPASYALGTGSLPWVKRPERGVDHPHLLGAKVIERVELNFYPLWAFVACCRVTFTFTLPAMVSFGPQTCVTHNILSSHLSFAV